MKLSIVIPAYNERGKIGGDIEKAVEFLRKNNITGEIIISDDGSTDGTAETAKQAAGKLPLTTTTRVIGCGQHHGKGYAVRSGIAASRGDYVMFADSGCCTAYEDALRGLHLIDGGQCEIAHGSRRLKETQIVRDQGFYRHICSLVFHLFTVRVMGIPRELTDTQCGFKVYRGDAARVLYAQCRTDGFMFDIEVILRALKAGYRIREFPIEWACDRDSRLSPTRSLWRILRELVAIKRMIGAI